ncbi:hypothetical protein [Leptolyngbya sp. 7M]|uniref:hypothetical protein n=1 Tax=Leptolyngbya sp. 7M TaxID=2812896 RepID=UPI001B8B7463|nr:hypothetical protein [Leptolyngbya sp. 7M]QYO65992.1 hypothetical protein JVX88_04100 [Leptolyngbya sp. 7M]
MSRTYNTIEEIEELVRSFEEATIERDKWKHAEHLVVALYYVEKYGLVTATEKMKNGILNLLKNGFGLDLSKEMPYHETLTIFWMRTVADFNTSRPDIPLPARAYELHTNYHKDLPLRHYTPERLFSDEARYRFIDGDI